jgi:DNA-binding response OmpR family regulator
LACSGSVVSEVSGVSASARILVAEHDPEILSLICSVLIQEGAEPIGIESGREAAEFIDREKFDGVFLDLDMSDVSGLKLIEKVRWSKSNSRCPIVMITGKPELDVVKKCFQAGANFFLEKPVTPEQVRTLFNATRGVMLQERRRYQRAKIRIPVACEWTIQSLVQEAQGESVNLSASGILLTLRLTPPSQGVVQLRFKLPGDPRPFDLTSRVVSIREGGQVGLSYVGIGEEDRRRLAGFTDLALRSKLGFSSARSG